MIVLDEAYIFVFVRQDLFNWQQLVHVGHAALEMGMELIGITPWRQLNAEKLRPYGHPNIIIVGMPDVAALNAVCEELRNKNLPFRAWTDPDEANLGTTSVITEPMTKQDRNKLHHHRPWSERNNANPKGAG